MFRSSLRSYMYVFEFVVNLREMFQEKYCQDKYVSAFVCVCVCVRAFKRGYNLRNILELFEKYLRTI